MQKELCKFCGTRDHHQSEMHLCSAMKRSSAVEQRPLKSSVAGSTPAASTKRKLDAPTPNPPVGGSGEHASELPEVRPAEQDHVSDAPSQAKDALTNAERCKRYRQKNAEKVRERDRLRKATKRGV